MTAGGVSGSLFFFLFQAEDGIRDLVRSRGLGDVYKRQAPAGGVPCAAGVHAHHLPRRGRAAGRDARRARGPGPGASSAPVSYTHLTLPTSDLV